ncbi:MAG TPA: substrate-binding domain-containing protein [Terriglobia bacterium]|nr:substrate-binding domain-containing protein [Terriglobia bacterium]
MDNSRGTRIPGNNRYLVKSIMHAAAVLRTFQFPGEILGLKDVASRSRLNKGLCFRVLYTLHESGLVEKVGENQYRLAFSPARPRKFRIGYADQDRTSSFSREVFDGLVRACQRAQIELIMVDNRRDPKAALKNADRLIHEHVDLAVEFQIDEQTAPTIASKFQNAGIPLIAIDIPHPGAVYFGADNYAAGLMAGRCLGHYVKKEWQDTADEILLLEISQAGSLIRMRSDGMLAGIREVVPASNKWPVLRLDAKGEFKAALDCVRKHLRTCNAKRILVGAANDPIALGALRAFQEAGRSSHCAVVGQNAEPEARAELRQSGTRLIGSVAYFPERYGDMIVQLATDILVGKNVPPAEFTAHQLITPQNVDRLYPNDSLFARVAPEYN